MMTNHSTRALHYLPAILVVALDRWSKLAVVHNIPLYAMRPVIPGFFKLTHTENPGAAFSLFADSTGPWASRALVAFSIIALSVVASLLWKQTRLFSQTAIAFSLILGGALGNLWDRVAHGRVVDFLLLYVGKYEWPVFNLADSSIVIGAGLLALSILTQKPGTES
jgi:signal peptidase II